MNANYCKICFVLDRSGSMSSVLESTIKGFNDFINEQKKVSGRCDVTLHQFDDVYETVYSDKNIQDVPELTIQTFVPRGTTALLDAMGKSINDFGGVLSKTPENERPGKILVIFQTDGGENASREFSKEKVFDLIKHQREKYSWEFVFLGANQDAITTAASYGISVKSSLTYSSCAVGTQKLYKSLSKKVADFRCSTSGGVDFDDEDRKTQENELKKNL